MNPLPGRAGLIFTGGPVYTPDSSRRRLARSPATAVAVTGGLITAVGSTHEIAALAGPGTEMVSLRGRALLPAFQDAHCHPAFAGVTMMRCDLAGAVDATQALERIAAYAAAHPGQEWITGSGWRMEWFRGGTPGREELDRVTGGRPAYLTNRDAHGAWVNSRALELAGLGATTPDPRDGRIERDPHGRPQGTLHEGAALAVARLVPPMTLAERVTGLLRAQQHLHSLGISAWQDAIVGDYLGYADPMPVYLAAAAGGRLTARVEGALWWDRERGGEQFADLLERRERARRQSTGLHPERLRGDRPAHPAVPGAGAAESRFRVHTVKIMQDGVVETYTAGMIEPYLDGGGCRTANSGLSHVDPAQLREQVTRLDAAGFGVHFHAIGDRAVREALDAVAAARTANGATPGRHHIAHLQVIHPDDIPRFAGLGVTANMQALWAAHEPQMDELTIPFIGPERAARQYPFAALLRSGARLAAGSDWAVSSANPLWAMHTAVTRMLPPQEEDGRPGTPPLLPEQALSLAEAAAAYTAGSAHVNNLDATGVIEPGMLADLVVLATDPFGGPPDGIGATRVALTYVGGERVYAAADA